MSASGKAVDPGPAAAAERTRARAALRLPLPRQTLVRHLLLAAAVALVLYLVSISLNPFDDLRLASVAYYFTALAGLTVLTGLNGQISLGHGALMAVGAYTAALLSDRQGWSLVPMLVAATAVTALVGVLVGAVAARLRGPYLAGATLALAVGLPALANGYSDALGGENGISVAGPTAPESLGFDFPLERWQAWISCAAAVIVLFVLANLVRGRLGRTFRAVRDDEVAAQVCGLSVARIQVLAFVISAACAGLAGGLLLVVTSLAAPGAFDLSLSLALLTGVVLGGLGSLAGALWGAIVLVLLPAWANDLADKFSLSNDVEANLPLAIYGLVLIGAMLAAPQGIQGALRGLRSRAARRLARRGGTAATKSQSTTRGGGSR